jgi:hypothetical protein
MKKKSLMFSLNLITPSYYSFSSFHLFFSINDLVEFVITGNFEQLNLPQLDENLLQIDYVDSLADIFINQ